MDEMDVSQRSEACPLEENNERHNEVILNLNFQLSGEARFSSLPLME